MESQIIERNEKGGQELLVRGPTGQLGSPTGQRNENSLLSFARNFIRIGAVSYLNSKPLIEGLSEQLGGVGRLSTDLPSCLADQLNGDQIDVGLIPVVEYFRNRNFRLVSRSAIISRGPVWSVRLFFRGSPSAVRRVAMDVGSRTSVALAKVLLHSRLGIRPEAIPLSMSADPSQIEADAVLLIGDRAMRPHELDSFFPSNWDLGQIWWEETGLPFVFAGWVARDPSIDAVGLGELLDRTREYGVSRIPDIARRTHRQYCLSEHDCVNYLTNYIHFELDQYALDGLEEFQRRCQHLKLVP